MGYSERLKSLNFRTFNDLINEVKIDFYAYDQESSIQVAELIKIAQQINAELGLRIYQTKETIVEVEHGRVKLPSDFYIMNFAMMCQKYQQVYGNAYFPTGYGEQIVAPYQNEPTQTTCPCWTIVSTGAQTKVTQCDGTEESVYFPPNDDGSAKTTKMCAMSIAAHPALTLTEGNGCWWNPDTGYSCDRPIVCTKCGGGHDVNSCVGINPDPWFSSKTYTVCNKPAELKVIQECNGFQREYTEFANVQFIPSKYASSFCTNMQFRQTARYMAEIKNGFIYMNTFRDRWHQYSTTAPEPIDCGKMYLNYQGTLEDEEGNLLVLDHPFINQFYEWAIKVKILESLYMNDSDASIERKLMYAKNELTKFRQTSLSWANMPEVYEIQQAYAIYRREQEYRFFNPWDKHYGNIPGISPIQSYFI